MNWAREECSTRHIQGIKRILLLPYWPDIASLLADGFSKREILEFLKSQRNVGCSYATFVQFCKQQQRASQKPGEGNASFSLHSYARKENDVSESKKTSSPMKSPQPQCKPMPEQTKAKGFQFKARPDPSLAEAVNEDISEQEKGTDHDDR